MTADLSALIARLEAAEVGSRELDALIWLRFNRPEYSGGVKALEMRGWYDGRGHMILETDTGEEVADDLGIGNYTTSLDAALALAEGVLPGWSWEIYTAYQIKGLMKYGCNLDEQDTAYAFTPALALCIAILRAKQGEGE
ncbi:hypothetical protein [Brevundimonas naejangsanensis]|uniref:hypothetical protein n=1 Tax=Brevundimonas naejangsanensis TaxID=588932 RepID=UPI000EEA0BA0|nr:hypothetical protein [Brevundimonas naejangsanensis]HAC01576.1 hypothetical protein [Brevundimonas sp.]